MTNRELLQALDSQISEAQIEISEIENERLRLIKLIVAEEYGAVPGAIVVHRGKEYRIAELTRLWSAGKPWVYGNPKRKDGSFGTALRHLFTDWEIVK